MLKFDTPEQRDNAQAREEFYKVTNTVEANAQRHAWIIQSPFRDNLKVLDNARNG